MSVSRRAFTIGLGAVPLQQIKAPAAQQPSAGNSLPGIQKAATSTSVKLFDEHELATVAALAELMIPATDTPGAREAQVAEHLDRILYDSPESARTSFLEGLWWTDGYCRRSAGAPLKELPVKEQAQIVSQLYDSSDPAVASGRSFVRAMKVWTAKIYYSTEIGHHELNKGGRVPSTYFRQCEA